MVLEFRSSILDSWSENKKAELAELLPAKLQQAMRSIDYAGPIEFPGTVEIVASINTVEELESIIHRIRRVLTDPEPGLPDLRTSIGIAVYPFDTGSPDALRQLAAQTASEWIEHGGHHAHFANIELESWHQTTNEIQEAMIRGLGHGEFEVLYQPIIDSQGEGPCAVEALIHWRGSKSSIQITTDLLLSLAERHNWLMNELDEWVFQNVATDAPRLLHKNGTPLTISLNIGLNAIVSGEFESSLKRHLQNHAGFDRRRLIFELPIQAITHERKRLESVISACCEMGVGWAINIDAQQIPLISLAELPVDWVKFDTRSLLGPLSKHHAVGTLRSMAELIRSLGSRTVFTHIEDSHLAIKMKHEINALLQGYALARPMPMNELGRWLEAQD
ncbi:hypothetical protein BW247_01145 [Acidihalobacter ferrooxydans]|uniref:EAL domain-containing protein n=2 Tax=Acidihalobacter ferrooxydans TaxID=1765967 RepID=A0A1P8UDK8_9GAMM|nr:hypothetical protein BW247_01145 [Acidihalobacter ferrooxydans]